MSSDLGAGHRRAGRPARSRLAKPLLTSIGVFTLLGTASIAVLGVASTGSARPWDWTGATPAAAATRYQLCGGRGLSAVGCLLSAAVRPAARPATPVQPPVAHQPLESVVTVEDRPTPPPAARPSATPRPAGTPRTAGTPGTPRTPPTAVPATSRPRPVPSPSGSPEPGDT
jgi:hypothetical protein